MVPHDLYPLIMAFAYDRGLSATCKRFRELYPIKQELFNRGVYNLTQTMYSGRSAQREALKTARQQFLMAGMEFTSNYTPYEARDIRALNDLKVGGPIPWTFRQLEIVLAALIHETYVIQSGGMDFTGLLPAVTAMLELWRAASTGSVPWPA